MWSVDKRYLNDSAFSKRKTKVNEVAMTTVDQEILKDKDPYYRVYNTTQNFTSDYATSYYHKSIGGYHAAKLKRYQDLIDYQLSKGNMSAFSMLNTKYFIVGNQQTQQLNVQMNPQVCGNAWFINEIKFVPNADSEMNSLTNFNPKNQVIIDERFKAELGDITLANDTTSTIKLTKYAPMQLDFESNANGNQFAVFSDIYYNKGWNVYVDGVKSDYVRVNYLLRGMKIASGKHSIVFKFEPEGYIVGEKIALASSLLLVLLVGFGAFKAVKNS
jgi:hypothetical protein